MLLTLLLQITPSSQGTPISTYVTIGAAVIAALASLNATRVSAKTAREVASIASQTASESARIAAATAREIKDTDYKHDFFKKIIARRLSSWERVEKVFSNAISILHDDRDNKHFFRFCVNGKKFDAIVEELKNLSAEAIFWMGIDFGLEFYVFYNLVVKVRLESTIKTDVSDLYDIDDNKLMISGKKYFPEMAESFNKLMSILSEQMAVLHDVDGFLNTAKYPSIFP